jgi:hypothetical protein
MRCSQSFLKPAIGIKQWISRPDDSAIAAQENQSGNIHVLMLFGQKVSELTPDRRLGAHRSCNWFKQWWGKVETQCGRTQKWASGNHLTNLPFNRKCGVNENGFCLTKKSSITRDRREIWAHDTSLKNFRRQKQDEWSGGILGQNNPLLTNCILCFHCCSLKYRVIFASR